VTIRHRDPGKKRTVAEKEVKGRLTLELLFHCKENCETISPAMVGLNLALLRSGMQTGYKIADLLAVIGLNFTKSTMVSR
jgi:hypothetical protein